MCFIVYTIIQYDKQSYVKATVYKEILTSLPKVKMKTQGLKKYLNN